jgi:hypothetical protein
VIDKKAVTHVQHRLGASFKESEEEDKKERKCSGLERSFGRRRKGMKKECARCRYCCY